MSFYSIPNIREKFFEIKTLTKVIGLPTIDDILEVYRQLKRNAQCVPTTLGGGQFRYLFAVLKDIAYAAIPGATAVVKPVDPGPFTLTPNPTPPATRGTPAPAPPPLTNAEIAVQKSTWEEKKRVYNEYQAVELAL